MKWSRRARSSHRIRAEVQRCTNVQLLHTTTPHVLSCCSILHLAGTKGHAVPLCFSHGVCLRQPLHFHDLSCKVEKSKTGLGDGKANFSISLLCCFELLPFLSLSPLLPFSPQPQRKYLILTIYSLKLKCKLCPPVPVHSPA